jgi:hypothetical protein
VEFALRNPNLFRLMHSPAMRTPPAAALEAHAILTRDLERAAAQGRLRLRPEVAAQTVMSANVGVALMLVSRPATFTDGALSRRVRDAVHASVLAPDALAPGGEREEGTSRIEVAAAAARLSTLLARTAVHGLTAAEAALLTEWLGRLCDASGPADPAVE